MNLIFNRSFAKAATLQPRALYECLADRLRERILYHALAPGDNMDESAIVKEYGVSRTPVREALKLLHHEGLLTARPRRGMSVTVLTPHEVQETWAIYHLLKAQAQSAPLQRTPPTPLLEKMLEMAERQLRLAYGPAFPAEKAARALGGGGAQVLPLVAGCTG